MSFFSRFSGVAKRPEHAYAQYLRERFQAVSLPGGTRIHRERDYIPVRGLAVAMASNPQLVVTGAPGMGKTMVLARLALAHARALAQDVPNARVPMYLTGPELASHTLGQASDLLQVLDSNDAPSPKTQTAFLAQALATGRALVLIDDLETLSAEATSALLKALNGIHVIATSDKAPAGLPEFVLPGWRDDDIKAVATAVHGKKAAAFLAALKSSQVPRSISAHPLSLLLLANLWRPDHPLPNRRTPLFDEYVQSVLGSANETARMLEETALEAQRGAPIKLELLAKGQGFIRAGKHRTAEFSHGLWQAYFAARALRQASDTVSLSGILGDPHWQETLLFYAGRGDANKLVDALVTRGDFALAGRALADAGAVRADLRDRVTQELARCAWEDQPGAIAALSEMGGTAAVDTLGARLKDKDPVVRTRAARILGQLQLDQGIEYLLPLLRDPDGEVRDQVVAALGHARTDRVVEPLLVALRGDPRVGKADTRLRVAAARALGEVGSDRAVTALMVDMQFGEPEVRVVAAEALKRITSPLMFKPLAGMVESGDAETRRYASEILAVAGGKSIERI